MKLTQKELLLINNIDFFNKYKKICNSNQNDLDHLLEKTIKEEVLIIFSKLNYTAKFNSKEKYYRIDEKNEDLTFGFWVSLKYGIVELGIDGKNKEDKLPVVLGAIVYDLFSLTTGEVFKKPRKANFRTYKELESILKGYLAIYEDFKKEFIKQYS